MKFLKKERRIRNRYITAFGLLLISYLLIFLVINQMEKRAKLVSNTNEVINGLNVLLSCIKDSEISYRDFIIIKDTLLLNNYYKSDLCIDSLFSSLKSKVQHDSIQKNNIETLYFMVGLHHEIINKGINDINSNHISEKALISQRIIQEMRIMEGIKKLIIKIQERENEVLERRTQEFVRTSRNLKIGQFITFFIALILVSYSVIVFNNISISKRKYREQLEDGIKKLKIANDDLINLRSMEKFVTSGRIARAIAHEVRNPLTSISLATEQLGASIKQNDDTSILLEIINRSVNRIHNLVLELLNSTKFTQLNLSRVLLNSVVEEALDLSKDRLELHNIQLIKSYHCNSCKVEVDVEKMRTAILNLIVNAIEAVQPGKGILEIKTIEIDNKCQIHIKDNGIGMNEKSISRIFEPYFTMKDNGNGLGLTLTQNIILNHKGNINVYSKPNNGTTFIITLVKA